MWKLICLLCMLWLIPVGWQAKFEVKVQDPIARVELNESNWKLMLNGEWLVSFCVPLMPDCLRLERVWHRFAHDIHERGSRLVVASMRMDYSQTLIRRFSLHQLPTLLHVKDGKFRQLPLAYTVDELRQLTLEDWKLVAPLPFWRVPNGLVMRLSLYYIQAIELVYDHAWTVLDYDHSTWLVRIVALLMVAMGASLVYSICRMLRYLWQMAAGKKPRMAQPCEGMPMQ